MDKYTMVKMLGKGGFGEAHLVKSKVALFIPLKN